MCNDEVGPLLQLAAYRSEHHLNLSYRQTKICHIQGSFDHGAWKSGDRLEAKKESFDDYLRNQPREYFSLFSERVAHDRMESYDAEVGPGETLADWMSTRALRSRGVYEGSTNLVVELHFFRRESVYLRF